MKQHKDRHVKEAHSSSERELVKCPDCEKSFSRKENMKEHWTIAHKGDSAQFRCELCEKPFTRKRNLTRHMEEEHKGGYYECSSCPATFTRWDNLQKHNDAGKHWQYVYCKKCKEVLKFKTKDERNWHCRNHLMPEKCVSLKDAKPSERFQNFHEGHVDGACTNCSKEYSEEGWW